MKQDGWDHSTHAAFYDYYATESESPATQVRFRSIQSAVLRVAARVGLAEKLHVADIGCGAGTQARLWAKLGHEVRGLDVNQPLIELARQRTKAHGLKVKFEVGSATELPWADASFDVCLLPELLEHVEDWQACLREAARVLRKPGLLYVSTTNILCPVQDEFELPAYSWYPAPLKRYFERLAVTSRPALANHAKYPAVHWFSFYALRNFLAPRGFHCLDRFDLIDDNAKSRTWKALLDLMRHVPLLRFLGHAATPGVYVLAVKQ